MIYVYIYEYVFPASWSVVITLVVLLVQDPDAGRELLQACTSEQWDVAEALIDSGSALEAQDKVIFFGLGVRLKISLIVSGVSYEAMDYKNVISLKKVDVKKSLVNVHAQSDGTTGPVQCDMAACNMYSNCV